MGSSSLAVSYYPATTPSSIELRSQDNPNWTLNHSTWTTLNQLSTKRKTPISRILARAGSINTLQLQEGSLVLPTCVVVTLWPAARCCCGCLAA